MASKDTGPETVREVAEQYDALNVDPEKMAERLSGRRDNLRKSKPYDEDGLAKFIWRMAQLHGGFNTDMPVKAHWHLQDFLDKHGIDASVSGVLDEEGKHITAYMHEVACEVLREYGHDPSRGAHRWKKAGAF